MEKINVVVADDHKLFRKGLMALLSDFSFINEIYEAENGIALLKLLKELEQLPDVILLDLKMPEMDGVEAHQEIRKFYPDIKVIILTMEDDEQYILHLIGEGVNGYLLKNADPEEMEIAIKKVVDKGFYFSDDISSVVFKSLQKSSKKEKVFNPEFTERELEALELICSEYSNAEVAEKMEISIRTAEGYKQKLLDKSGAKNIAGLVVMALKYSWIRL
jgi:DNA-binding NarL/FixJ family response regulator